MCYFETLKLGTKLKDDEILATANIGIAETYRNADKMKTKEHYKSAWSSLAKIRDEYTFFRGFSLGDSVIGHSYASAQKDSSFPLHKVMTEEFLEAIINGGRLN